MPEIKYVDLAKTSSGHAGTSLDPYSWADVRTRMQDVQDAMFDTGSVFDSGSSFDGAAINIEFKLRGVGDLFTNENAMSFTNFRCLPGSEIAFSADDPMRYGLPVLRSPAVYGAGVTAPTSNSSFIRFDGCERLNVRLTGILLDIDLPLASNSWRFMNVTNPLNSTLVANNCVVLDRGAGNRLLSFTGADASSRVATWGNTVMYSAAASGSHEFVRVEGCQLYNGRNIAVQSATSTAVVSWATCTTSMYVGGNGFGLLASSIIYNGVSPQVFEIDELGLDTLTQCIWNPSFLNGANENPFSYLNPGVSHSRSSVFWPVHGSPSLGLGVADIPLNVSIVPIITDAFGHDRLAGFVDAGAFQKTRLPIEAKIHVDLSLSTLTGNSGTSEDPISAADFILDYQRRAPIDNKVTYLLRGRNDSASYTEFDLGPVSPNLTAAYNKFGGRGSVLIVGWRANSRKLPIFSARKIRPNADLELRFKSVKLDFRDGGSANFIDSSVQADSKFKLVNCVVRSRAASNGRIINTSTGHNEIHVVGTSIHVAHSSGVGSGIFGAGSKKFYVELSAINLPNTSVLGSGGTNVQIKCCVINTGASGNATWAGASFDSLTRRNAAQPFIDPANVDYDLADYKLVDGSVGIEIAPFASSLSPDNASEVEYDARNLRRSAFPLGNTSMDAGAYEHDFYVPPAKDFYLDLSKTRPGTGKPGDRWSPNDFKHWVNTVDVLDRRIVVHSVRRGRMELEVPLIEYDANGSIEIKAEQPNDPACWMSGDFEMLSGETEVPLQLTGMIVAVDGSSKFANLPNSKLKVINSIIDKKHTGKLFYVSVIGSTTSAGDTVTLATLAGNISLQPVTDWNVGETEEETAENILIALIEAGFPAKRSGSTVLIVDAISVSLGVAPTALSTSNSVSLMSGDFEIAGCSIAEEFELEIGFATKLVEGTAKISHTAFQGHNFSATTRTAIGVDAVGTVERCGFNDCVTNVATATQTGNVTSPSNLFAVVHSVDRNLSDFELNGSALVGIGNSSALAAWASGSELDILGNLRFNSLLTTSADIDAGAIEKNFIASDAAYLNEAGDPIASITEEGYMLNSRQLAGLVHFQLVGYVVGRGGYNYWDPTKPLPPISEAKPMKATVVASVGAWATESLTINTPAGNAAVVYGVDFEAGATAVETLENILAALRLIENFNEACWGRVSAGILEIYSWTHGDAASGFSIAESGTLLTVTAFSGTQDSVVAENSWPTSGYAPWFKFETPDPRSRSFVARLDFADANGAVGEIVAVAKVISSPIPNEIGKEYAYARMRFPIHVKHNREIFVNRLMLAH